MHETQAKKLKGSHYIANHGRLTPDSHCVHTNRGYSTDGEESHRAASERTISEYTVAHERTPQQRRSHSLNKLHFNGSQPYLRDGQNGIFGQQYTNSPLNALQSPQIASGTPTIPGYNQGGDTGSDIYVTSAAYKAHSDISRYSQRPQSRSAPRSVYSEASSAKTGRSHRSVAKHGARIETMSAPNPFCPNIKGVCCLMLLLNLGLFLVTLGFVIVVQFYDPLYVWILGIIFLIFGFLTLIGSMIYCVHVCRDAKTPSQVRNEDLYWTRHWHKNIGYVPNREINYKRDKYDAYSDHYSISKLSGKFSDRDSNRY